VLLNSVVLSLPAIEFDRAGKALHIVRRVLGRSVEETCASEL
jgi:hypothetical protein